MIRLTNYARHRLYQDAQPLDKKCERVLKNLARVKHLLPADLADLTDDLAKSLAAIKRYHER